MRFIRLIALTALSAFALSGCATSETQISSSCRYVVDANAPKITRAEACSYTGPKKTIIQPNANTGWDTLAFLISLGI